MHLDVAAEAVAGPCDIDAVLEQIAAWSETGASHLSINTVRAGLNTVDDHLGVRARVAESL